MAREHSKQELKDRARALMARGREEMDSEIHALQLRLKPQNMARSALESRPVITLGGAFLVGLFVALQLYPHHKSESTDAKKKEKEKPELRRPNRSLLGTIAASALSAGVPHLVRGLINKVLNGSGFSATPAPVDSPPIAP